MSENVIDGTDDNEDKEQNDGTMSPPSSPRYPPVGMNTDEERYSVWIFVIGLKHCIASF